jgi:hypothetical protein
MCVEVFMKLNFFVTVILSLIIAGCATSSSSTEADVVKMTRSVNTEKYGENAPKIWTPLTQIEMGALIKAKMDPDNESQMVLSLFFTGDIREGEEIGASIGAYRTFIELCDTELAKIKDAKEKGKKLHELFFKQFIGSPRKKDAPSSGIFGLLTKKEYDANTAALLFAIIAQKYGFTSEISFTKGIVEEIVNQKTGLSIKIFSGKAYLTLKHKEMYSPAQVIPFLEDGFDPYINLSFFENMHEKNPSEFEDAQTELGKYYKRMPLTFEKALLFQYKIDKLNETAETENPPMNRRIEMAAHLTDLCDIHLDRIRAWRNTYPFILQKKIPGEMFSFIDTINSELNRTAELCKDEPDFEDLAWDLFLFSAFEYSDSLDGVKLKTALFNGYRFLSTSSKDYEKKKVFLANSLSHYLNKIISSDVIEKELATVKDVIAAVPVTEIRTGSASSFYYQSGEHYLAKKDLWRAGQFYAECSFVYGGQYQKICIQKGVDSLYKYAQTCLGRGVCATASDAVSKCMEKIPDKKECQKIKDLYDQQCGK